MAENLTPAQLPVGSPTDTSVVHASENNVITNSKGHNERDISRLQGTAQPWIENTEYNAGDLVFRDGIVWRSNNGQVSQMNFDSTQWDPVSPNTQPFTIDRDYVPGDLVSEEGIVYRANTTIPIGVQGVVTDTNSTLSTLALIATNSTQVMIGQLIDVFITAPTAVQFLNKVVTNSTATEIDVDLAGETGPVDGSSGTWQLSFQTNEWKVVGVGAKNVVQIFSQLDFPPLDANNEIPLANNTEYIISAPITITEKFFIAAGYEIMVRALADETNIINVNIQSADSLFRSNSAKDDITAISDIGGGQLEVSTSSTSGLVAGQLVNLILNTGNFFSKEIVTVNSGILFTIDLGGETAPGTSTGNYDQGIKVLELEDLILKDIVGAIALETSFARIPDSECFIFHVIVDGFQRVANIEDVGQFSWDASNFFRVGTGFTLTNVRRAFLNQLSFQDKQGGQTISDIIVLGDQTEFVDISQVIFETNSNQFAIEIGDGLDPIGADIEVHVENCKDINFDTSLFNTATSGLDETDPRMFVHDNGKQKNSVTQAMLTCNPATVNNLGTFEPLDQWVENSTERFTLIDPTNEGILQYDGLSAATVIINYTVDFQSNEMNTNDATFAATIFKDISGTPTEITTTFNSVVIPDGEDRQLSGTAIVLVDVNDEFQLRVRSTQINGNYEAILTRFTMHEIG